MRLALTLCGALTLALAQTACVVGDDGEFGLFTDTDTETPIDTGIAMDDPSVARLNSSEAPSHPAALKVSCDGATCPVLFWNGYEYWAFSYDDNRYAIAVIAYDLATGERVERWNRDGTRYVSDIDVRPDAIVFLGQGGTEVVFDRDTLWLPPR